MPAFLTPPGGAAASIFGGNARPTIGAAPAGVKRMFLLRFSRPESAEVSAFARDSQRGSRVQRKLSTKLRTAIFGPGDCAAATFRSEEHTSELQSLMRISYAVFCLKKKKKKK